MENGLIVRTPRRVGPIGRAKKRHLGATLLAVVLVVAGLVVGPPSPAVASANDAIASMAPVTEISLTGKADCPGSYVCFWVDTYYGGSMGKFAGDNSDWGIYAQAQCANGDWDNCASSTFNNGSECSVKLYKGPGYTGYYLWEQRGSFRDNLTLDFDPDGASFNDSISSNKWC